jgi:uncharacterized protein with HEPN domain
MMTSGKDFAEFNKNLMLRSAVERQFEIIGEALGTLARVDQVIAARIPELKDIVAFRNILIHGYAVIDRARVWRVVEHDLPRLRTNLAEILRSLP